MMRASWQRLDPGKAKVMPVGQGKHLLPRVGVGGGKEAARAAGRLCGQGSCRILGCSWAPREQQ